MNLCKFYRADAIYPTISAAASLQNSLAEVGEQQIWEAEVAQAYVYVLMPLAVTERFQPSMYPRRQISPQAIVKIDTSVMPWVAASILGHNQAFCWLVDDWHLPTQRL